MRTHGLGWWIAITIFLSYAAVVSGHDGPKLETMDQYTRLQIPVTSGSSFRMLSGKDGEVSLTVDRVATRGLEGLDKMSDARVRAIAVRQLGLDRVSVAVSFREPRTEAFAYQQGNTLVVDVWRQAPAAARPATKLPSQVKKASKPAPRSQRQPASGPAVRANTPAVEPLSISRDLFQRFILPMPLLEVKGKNVPLPIPLKVDLASRWKFASGDSSKEDGKGFELAKRLFQSGKYGLCLKTIEITLAKTPDTEHASELAFLRALSYRKLGETQENQALLTKADGMLEELGRQRDEKARPPAYAREIILYFAQKSLEDENWLQAIQHLENVASATKPDDPELPYVQMLLADAYGRVSQPRRAERIYRFVAEKFPGHFLAKEAQYRVADLLALEKNYKRVAEEGEEALKAYPGHERARSEVVFHIGEAYFWLGRYDMAERFLRRYVEKFSARTEASLAWVRLGEIEEVHRGDVKAARAAYMRSKNGYPFSKGDLMATVRLARIDLPGEKELSFVISTLNQLLEDKTVEWDLRRMAELTLASYKMKSGDIEGALAIAVKGMAHTEGAAYELYRKTYQKGIFLKLNGIVKQKRYAEALAFFGSERKWLEDYGPETFRVMSEVYRGLGLYASANAMMERFSSEVEKGRLPAGYDGRGKVNQEKAANSFAKGDYASTLVHLSSAQDPMSVYLRALSHFRLGHKREAYATAEKALPLMAADRARFDDKMIEEIGEILLDRGTSERDFKRMEADVARLVAACSKENDLFTYAAADVLWYQKRHPEAVKAYKAALEKFPQSSRAERARYNMGMSLLGSGKRDEAVKLLTDLRDSGQSVWSESARQELELIEWEKKYSSVLRTLPPEGLGILR